MDKKEIKMKHFDLNSLLPNFSTKELQFKDYLKQLDKKILSDSEYYNKLKILSYEELKIFIEEWYRVITKFITQQTSTITKYLGTLNKTGYGEIEYNFYEYLGTYLKIRHYINDSNNVKIWIYKIDQTPLVFDTDKRFCIIGKWLTILPDLYEKAKKQEQQIEDTINEQKRVELLEKLMVD